MTNLEKCTNIIILTIPIGNNLIIHPLTVSIEIVFTSRQFILLFNQFNPIIRCKMIMTGAFL